MWSGITPKVRCKHQDEIMYIPSAKLPVRLCLLTYENLLTLKAYMF